MIRIWYERIFASENIRIYSNIRIFATPWYTLQLLSRTLCPKLHINVNLFLMAGKDCNIKWIWTWESFFVADLKSPISLLDKPCQKFFRICPQLTHFVGIWAENLFRVQHLIPGQKYIFDGQPEGCPVSLPVPDPFVTCGRGLRGDRLPLSGGSHTLRC